MQMETQAVSRKQFQIHYFLLSADQAHAFHPNYFYIYTV